jgi:hypothetical protein
MEIVATANVLAIDECLGHAAPAATYSCHGSTGCFIAINGVFHIANSLAIQQLLGTDAKGTGAPGIDLDACHR